LFTGIRDYVHVMDLAEGHVAALKKLQSKHAHLQVTIIMVFFIQLSHYLYELYLMFGIIHKKST